MRKIIRIVWISVLSGLAFLSACCTQNGLTRRERKQLTKERDQVEMQLSRCKGPEIDTPDLDEYMARRNEVYSLQNKLDTINFRLGEDVDLDHNVRRRQILQRIDSLNFLIETYSPPCIYGSPEMMEEGAGHSMYDPLYEYNEALKAAEKELEDLDRINTEEQEIHELLYGGPAFDLKPVKPAEPVIIQVDSTQN